MCLYICCKPNSLISEECNGGRRKTVNAQQQQQFFYKMSLQWHFLLFLTLKYVLLLYKINLDPFLKTEFSSVFQQQSCTSVPSPEVQTLWVMLCDT